MKQKLEKLIKLYRSKGRPQKELMADLGVSSSTYRKMKGEGYIENVMQIKKSFDVKSKIETLLKQ